MTHSKVICDKNLKRNFGDMGTGRKFHKGAAVTSHNKLKQLHSLPG